MKTIDMQLKPMPDQFWFNQYNNRLIKIKSYRNEHTVIAISCYDNKEFDFVLPVNYTLLWYQSEIGRINFDREIKFGQIWVDNLTDKVFLIHPDQPDSIELVRILSNSCKISNVYKAYTLIYDPDQEIINQVHIL